MHLHGTRLISSSLLGIRARTISTPTNDTNALARMALPIDDDGISNFGFLLENCNENKVRVVEEHWVGEEQALLAQAKEIGQDARSSRR